MQLPMQNLNPFKQALFFLALTSGTLVHAQIITSIAGNGTAGYNDEVTATAAQLYAPQGVAVYGSTIFVADGMNNRLRRISGLGEITTIAGNDYSGNNGQNGPATDAQLNGPAGVAADFKGNLYIADKYNNQISIINPAGIINGFAGTGTKGLSGDGGPASAALLNAPAGIAADTAGNIYIADGGNHCIRKVSPDGIIKTIGGTGVSGFSGDGGNATAAMLNTPTSVAVDSTGNVYVADSWNYRIRKISSQGIITTIAGTGAAGYGGDGNWDTLALLNLPTGIVTDKAGNLFIADQGNNRIRKIDKNGIISTAAGIGTAGFSGDGGNALNAELNAPYGIALDAAGNLYIAEQQNNRIRKVTPPPAAKVVKNTKSSTKPYNPPPITNPPLHTPPPAVNTGYQYSPASAPAPVKTRHKNGG